jgi:hypothetical protein
MIIDEELKECAALALRNAFWHDFSALVNCYLAASADLDVAAQLEQMGDLTSVYGRDWNAKSDDGLNIWTQNSKQNAFSNVGHATIVEALEHPPAVEVHLRGTRVFEKRDGEWYFLG